MPVPKPDRNDSDSHRSWLDRHLWQIQPIRDLLVIALVVGLLYLGALLSLVTVPLLLALLLAYLFEPVVQMLVRRFRFSRSAAAATIIVAAIVGIVIPLSIGVTYAAIEGVGLVRDVFRNAESLITFADGFDRSTDQAAGFAQRLENQATEVQTAYQRLPNRAWRGLAEFYITEVDRDAQTVRVVEDWVRTHAPEIAKSTIGTGADAARAILIAVVGAASLGFRLFLTGFFFFFLSVSYSKVIEFGHNLIPSRIKPKTLDLISKMDRVIAAFVRGRLTICAIQCVVFSVAYSLIGIPTPVLLGVLVGVLSIVPYLALIGLPISIALLWLDPAGGFRSEWWWVLGAPAAVYFLGQALDDYVWTPMIQGKSTNMDTPTILFASLAGGVLAGAYGLLLAIPAAACVKILLREVFWPKFVAWSEGRAKDILPISEE